MLALLASTAVNVGLFRVAFRLATARAVQLWLGAVVSAVLWQVLLAMGALLITHEVKHSQELYGTFGVVLGLLAWLRLQAQLTLYAIEADVVRVRRLWPRSVAPPPLTSGDRRAYEAYAEAKPRHRAEAEQNVEVNFPEQSTAGGTSSRERRPTGHDPDRDADGEETTRSRPAAHRLRTATSNG